VKKSNKLTAAVTASMVASTLVVPAAFASTSLTDIDNSYAKDAILELVNAGIINGTGDGKFNPAGKISRQDFAIILAKALNLDTESAPETATFKDVPTTHYSYKFVEAAVKAELIAGLGDGVFGLGQNLTREQMAVLFVRATGEDVAGYGDKLTFADADKISPWAKDAVGYAVEIGLMNGAGNNSFNPQGLAERQQVALVASNFLNVQKPAEVQLTDVALVDDTTLTLNFNKALDAITAEDVKVAVKGTGTAVAVSSVTLSEDKKSATVKVAKLASGTTFAVSYKTAPAKEVTTVAVKAVAESAKSIANTKVKVTFKDAVDATVAAAANFEIKNATAALEVKNAEIGVDGKSVVLTTAAQEIGKAYTVAVKGTDGTFNIVGQPADTSAPTLDTAVAKGNKKVEVAFSEDLSEVGTLATNNFAIEGLQVQKVEFAKDADGNFEFNKVLLTTDSQTAGKVYKVVVSNLTDVNGNKVDADKDEKTFGGVAADTAKPNLSTAVAHTNKKVQVTFSEEVDAATAEVAANYVIEGLAIEGAKVDAKDSKIVWLTTAEQTPGKVYKLVVSNVTDLSGNVIHADNDEKTFGGIAKDTTKPNLSVAVASTNTSIEVSFSETVDKTTAENVANYKIEGLVVKSAKVDADDAKKVILETEAQTAGKVYKLVVENVTDESGNVIHSDNDEKTFGGVAADTTKPQLATVTPVDSTTLTVVFSEKVSKATAQELTNYHIEGLGYATKATLAANGTTVTLKTPVQTSGKIYKLAVTNVKDLSGNVIHSDYDEKNFAGVGTGDTRKPRVASAIAIDENTMQVTFDEAMDSATIATTDFSFAVVSGTETATPIAAGSADAFTVSEDKKTVTLGFATERFTQGVVYRTTVATVTDASGNNIDADYDTADFAGLSATNAAPKVESAYAVTNNIVDVTFSEAIVVPGGFLANTVSVTHSVSANPEAPKNATSVRLLADGKTLRVYLGANLTAGQVYSVTVPTNGSITDALGLATLSTAQNANTYSFAGISTTNEAPTVAAAISLNNTTVDVKFSEAIQLTGGFSAADIQLFDKTGANVTAGKIGSYRLVKAGDELKTGVTSSDTLRLFLNANANLVAGDVYKVVIAGTNVADLDGATLTTTNNKNAAEFGALNSTNAPAEFAVVEVTGTNTLKVTFSKNVTGADTVNSDDFVLADADGVEIPGLTYTVTDAVAGDNVVTLSAQNVGNNFKFAKGSIFKLKLAAGNTIKDEAGTNGAAAKADTVASFGGTIE
jgi:hypothetical protein